MLPVRKRVPVMAVLLNSNHEAIGFSKPLSDSELAGDMPIRVDICEESWLHGVYVEFAVPGGIIKKTTITCGLSVVSPGDIFTIYQ